MADFNASLNDTAKPFNLASRKILEWEKTGDIRILNNKQIPTRVPARKGDQANCLDLMMISPGLENRTYNYKSDGDRMVPSKSRIHRSGRRNRNGVNKRQIQ